MSLACPRCGKVITAAGEENFVAKVQRHVREDHDLDHTLPPKHVLARLRRATETSSPGEGQ